MHKWDSIANYRSCFYHVTNVFSKGTQFNANIRLQIHLDSVSTCPWKNIHVFKQHFNGLLPVSAYIEKLKVA